MNRLSRLPFVLPALLLSLLLAARMVSAAPGVVVEGAWVRVTLPGNPAAAYMVLRNAGPEPARLLEVRSPAFAAAEIHRTWKKDGLAGMDEVSQVEVPAKGELTMAPGGIHVMLMRAGKSLKAGERVPLVLRFAGGSEIKTGAAPSPG